MAITYCTVKEVTTNSDRIMSCLVDLRTFHIEVSQETWNFVLLLNIVRSQASIIDVKLQAYPGQNFSLVLGIEYVRWNKLGSNWTK
jgi:hypothetical protein